MEIFGIKLHDNVKKMSEIFGDNITIKESSRGFLIDGIFFLLQYCDYDKMYYMEIARTEDNINNTLGTAKKLINFIDYILDEYGKFGMGMYKDSQIKQVMYLFEKKYTVEDLLSNGSIVVKLIRR